MYNIVQIFTDNRLNAYDEVIGKQKVAYVEVDGVIHVVRYDYEIGTPDEEVNAENLRVEGGALIKSGDTMNGI